MSAVSQASTTGIPPHSTEIERAIIARMLRDRRSIGEILGRYVGREDFHLADCRLLFERIIDAHYSDGAIDPVVIGERVRTPLSEIWGIDEGDVAARLRTLATSTPQGPLDGQVVELKRLSQRRHLIDAATIALAELQSSEVSETAVAQSLQEAALKAQVGGSAAEVLNREDRVRQFMKELMVRKQVREAGGELGVFTGFHFFDEKIGGIQPGEVVMLAGEPGVGKSLLAGALTRAFAHRQLHKPVEQRVGTLTINLEMTPFVDMIRDAQSVSGVWGSKMRTAEVDDADIRRIAQAYRRDRFTELPLFSNYASRLTFSQIRAVILDALNRGWNTGFVVIDHFRMFDLDRGMLPRDAGQNQVDEEKARCLKELAKDLNVAILCLSHTVKMRREGSDGRPSLSDLRGSYQVAAYCDVVAFVYQPRMYASAQEIENFVAPDESDAELILAKNRNGRKGTNLFFLDGGQMVVADPT